MDGAQIQGADYEAQYADIKDMDEFYDRIEHLNVVCGWRRDLDGGALGVSEPSSPYKTAHWKYAECKVALAVAAKLISAEEAGRRILNFRNPIEENKLGAARSLLHAYQLVMPGEKAPSHRHTAHALRVILDSKDMYSVVNGEKTLMETGDVVLTPGGMWHSHEHNGDEPAYWIDGLDVPLVKLLQVQTFDLHPDGYEKVDKVVEVSPMRFSGDDIQKRLDGARADGDGYFGTRVQLEAPDIPPLALYIMRLEAGRTTRAFRTNANTSFAIMDGSGTSIIDGEEIHWSRGDIFVAPTWRWIEHRPSADTQMFSMTDEPLMRFAKYYRFEGKDE
ncbi:MAG: cupin domain-containing protein [Rhodospirillales bacterium]|nr:cupin domain-containing protein [Rhodospirillales bacterium]